MNTAVVVCNGPSLAEVPNEWLEQYTTFAANRIHLKEGFTPTYLAICDDIMTGTEDMVLPVLEMINKVDRVFLSWPAASDISSVYPLPADKLDVFHLKKYWNKDTGEVLPTFSKNPLIHLFHGYTITYFIIQVAAWLGFDRLLCVGLDHDYNSGTDHFHPEYNEADIDYADYHTWWDKRTRPHFECARDYYESIDGEIINCTPNSKLDVFPIADWSDYGPE